MPYTWYSVVINNPTDEDTAALQRKVDDGWLVEGQKEVGKEGTPHLQLAVATRGEDWGMVKAAFPRANISEAKDVGALRKYVVKTETRSLDFTLSAPAHKSTCLPSKLDNVSFYDALFTRMEMEHTGTKTFNQSIIKDTTMALYDAGVCSVIRAASTPDSALTFATRAIRPDVRALYRRYRAALLGVWLNSAESEEITVPTTNADDDASEQQESGGEVGEEHDDACSSESEADEDGEEDSDSLEESEDGD